MPIDAKSIIKSQLEIDEIEALQNVAANIVPNVLFRSADYIYKSN